MSGRAHHDLNAWKESLILVRRIYEITGLFPKDELYGLSPQMRRAAVSIPSNIAEGAARTSSKEFIQFVNISRGSLSELETQLLIARDLGYIAQDQSIFDLLDSVSKLITGLHKHLTSHS